MNHPRKHPAKWTEEECYESAFLVRATRQEMKLAHGIIQCSNSMPLVYKEDKSLANLKRAWIRGWQDAL